MPVKFKRGDLLNKNLVLSPIPGDRELAGPSPTRQQLEQVVCNATAVDFDFVIRSPRQFTNPRLFTDEVGDSHLESWDP